MKRILVLLASLALIATPAAAVAEEDQSFATSIIGFSPLPGDRGISVVDATGEADLVAAFGTVLNVTVGCYGPQCRAKRPARLQIKRGGTWTTWSERTVKEWKRHREDLTSKKSRLVVVRTLVPAYQGLPALTSPETRIRFLPPTSVRVSGTLIVKPSASPIGDWQFRPQSGTIRLQLTPASSGRLVQVRDSGKDGYPLVAEANTDSRGAVTLDVDLSGITSLQVVVPSTPSRAGWQIRPFAID